MIAMLVLNAGIIVYFKIRNDFPRILFFIFGSINVIICSVLFLIAYGYVHNGNICAKNKVFMVYTIL